MEKFKPTVIAKEFITAASDALVTQNALVFNDGVGSSTILTDDQALNNNYKNSQSISKDVPTSVSGYKNVDTNTIVANVKISNKTLSADVRISTILIYASYNGNNILAATARLNAPELLPAYDTDKGTPVTLEFAVYMQVSNNINAPVQFNEAGLATSADLRTVDASAVHKSGDETIDGIKKFLKPINGTAEITIHYLWDDLDLNTLVENSVYVANNVKVLQSSVKENFIMRVEAGNSKFPVKQTKYSFDTGMTYVRYQNNGSWTNFIKQPTDDSVLVHLFGDETIDGNKTFLKNIATTSDNSMINGGGNDKSLALVKQSGTQPFVAFGNTNQVQIKKSNNAAINPTDTFRTILNIADNGQVNVGVNQDLVPLDKNVAHKSGDETIDGIKKFLNPISGSLLTRKATFTDFLDVANDMVKYSGNWYVYDHAIKNDPSGLEGGIRWYSVTVTPAFGTVVGHITIEVVDGTIYNTGIDNGKIKGWHLIPHDNDIVHNTGDETVAGDKTFTGSTTFTQPINGSLKTRVAPFKDLNDVAKNMIMYSGYWQILGGSGMLNGPYGTVNKNAYIMVQTAGWADAGSITYYEVQTQTTYIGFINSATIVWKKNSDDSTVVHNTGDETVKGTKTFEKPINGNVTGEAAVANYKNNLLSDNSDVASIAVSGYYYARNANGISGLPKEFNAKYFDLSAWVNGSNGFMIIVDDSNNIYFRKRQNGAWQDYTPMPLDATKLPRNDRQETIHEEWTFEKNLHATTDYSYRNVMIDIADGTDLNTLRDAGSYSCGINRVGNSPISNWFTLVVVVNGPYNGSQTLTGTNNGEVYTRTWNNSGSWFSPWEKLSSDSKVVHNSGDETIKGNKKFESKIDGVVESSMYSAQTRLQIVAENYNVDGLTSPGLYGGTNGHLVGLPAYPIWGCLEVMNTPEGDVIQRFNVTNGIDASVLQRVKNNSGWKDWKKVI